MQNTDSFVQFFYDSNGTEKQRCMLCHPEGTKYYNIGIVDMPGHVIRPTHLNNVRIYLEKENTNYYYCDDEMEEMRAQNIELSNWIIQHENVISHQGKQIDMLIEEMRIMREDRNQRPDLTDIVLFQGKQIVLQEKKIKYLHSQIEQMQGKNVSSEEIEVEESEEEESEIEETVTTTTPQPQRALIAGRCNGTTLKNEPCKMKVKADAYYCHHHKKQDS